MSDAGAEQLQKTLSRKKNPNKRVNNSHKGVKDNGKGKKREVEDEELGLRKGEIAEVLVGPSTSAESHREGEEGKKKYSEDACRQIENGGGGSSSASRPATQKRKSNGRGGGSLGRNKQPEHKKQKQEKQSQERRDLELKAKTKQKQEGKDAGEREVVKNKVEETKKKKKKKKKEEEEDEGGAGCRFPMSRVDRIIRSEGSDYRITHEAVFLINKATEKFLEVFCEDSYKRAAQDCKNYVSYKNLSSVVSKDRSLYFLSDYIPEKVKAEDALAERKLAEK